MLTQKQELILISLQNGKKTGQEIKSAILDATSVDLLPGSLYPTLEKMLDDSLIEIYTSTKRSKIYQITKEGEMILNRQNKRRKQLQTI